MHDYGAEERRIEEGLRRLGRSRARDFETRDVQGAAEFEADRVPRFGRFVGGRFYEAEELPETGEAP
jgi:hypothetical protein